MRTIVVETLDVSKGVHPKTGYSNIRLKKNGNGEGLLSLRLNIEGVSVAKPGVISIDGGVFIDPTTEGESTVMNRTTTALVTTYVRVDRDVAFISFQPGKRFGWKQMEDARYSAENSPMVDYAFNFKGIYTLNNLFEASPTFNSPVDALGRELPFVNAKSLTVMFANTLYFNQDISNWDVSAITNMGTMFNGALSFNQDITNWNVANVTGMHAMFNNATAFNQDISKWEFNLNVDFGLFLDRSGLSPENYSKLLVKLAAKDWTGRTKAKSLSAVSVKYDSDGEAARAALVASGWTIADGGLYVD